MIIYQYIHCPAIKIHDMHKILPDLEDRNISEQIYILFKLVK